MNKSNKNIVLIAGIIILLLIFSINFNDLGNKSNFPFYLGVIGLITFVLLKSKK